LGTGILGIPPAVIKTNFYAGVPVNYWKKQKRQPKKVGGRLIVFPGMILSLRIAVKLMVYFQNPANHFK